MADTATASAGGAGRAPSWQERLNEYCRDKHTSPPDYNIVSDRRGGRTAWSATVTISSIAQSFQARFWYDGQFLNNAKEDAAEVALRYLKASVSSSSGLGSPSPTAATAGSDGFPFRGSSEPSISASTILPAFGAGSPQRRGNAIGVMLANSQAAQQGFPRPAW